MCVRFFAWDLASLYYNLCILLAFTASWLTATHNQVKSDVSTENAGTDDDDDDDTDLDVFNIGQDDLQKDGALVLGDTKAIRRRMSKISPNICRNEIIMQIMVRRMMGVRCPGLPVVAWQ